jgi:hypothetical protein
LLNELRPFVQKNETLGQKQRWGQWVDPKKRVIHGAVMEIFNDIGLDAASGRALSAT